MSSDGEWCSDDGRRWRIRGLRSKKAVPESFWRDSSRIWRHESGARCNIPCGSSLSSIGAIGTLVKCWLTIDTVLEAPLPSVGQREMEGELLDEATIRRRVSSSGVLE